MTENQSTKGLIVVENKQADLNSIINDPRVPKVYANGFLVGNSITDVTLISQTGGAPSAVIFMTFTSLKALQKNIDAVIKNIEKGLGEPIEDLVALNERFNKNSSSNI